MLKLCAVGLECLKVQSISAIETGTVTCMCHKEQQVTLLTYIKSLLNSGLQL